MALPAHSPVRDPHPTARELVQESLSELLADLAAELRSLRHVCLFTATAFLLSLKKDGVASRNQPQNHASTTTRRDLTE